jgi:hypothetical protein
LIPGFSRHADICINDDIPLGEHVFFVHVTMSPLSESHTANIATAENVLNGHLEIITLRVPVYMHVVPEGSALATAGVTGTAAGKEVNADALPSRIMPGVEQYAGF